MRVIQGIEQLGQLNRTVEQGKIQKWIGWPSRSCPKRADNSFSGQSSFILPDLQKRQRLLSARPIIGLQLPQLHRLQAKDQEMTATAIRQAVQAEQLRLAFWRTVPTLGFDNLIADWAFLNFLQYFGDEPARQKTDYALSPDFFEVILKRDPFFVQAYPFLSTSTSIYAGLPERSVTLMQRGLASLRPNIPPNAYFAWRQLAIDQLLFLGDVSAARQSFLTAAQWAAQSPLPESQNAASLSLQTAELLANNPDSKMAQVAAWVMVLNSAPDERTRTTAVQRIEALGGQITANPDGTFNVVPPSKD